MTCFVCYVRIMGTTTSQTEEIATWATEKRVVCLKCGRLSAVDGLLQFVEAQHKRKEWLKGWERLERRATVLTDDFDRRCREPWVSSADVNDLRSQMVSRLPRCMWLQMNGDARGDCYAPFLCAHYHVGVPYDQFVELLGRQFGSHLTWGKGSTQIFHRQRKDGLRRHSSFLSFASWGWMDPTCSWPHQTTSKSQASFLLSGTNRLLFSPASLPFMLLDICQVNRSQKS
jgi:hypothetical protein